MAEHDADDVGSIWPPEWWERGVARRERWGESHRPVVAALRGTRSVLLAVALLWLVVAAVLLPELRAGLAAWLGATWIAFVGYVLMRTKTLSWGGYWALYAAALVWSVAVALLLAAVARAVGPDVDAAGPSVAVAALGEESLKLVPALLLAVLAPVRVHRFALADWLLVGLASGAAFTAVEEAVRRVSRLGTEQLDALPAGFTRFGLLGSDPGYEGPVQYAGHHVVTGLVVTAGGAAVLLLRRAGRTTGRARALLAAAAVVLPLVTWWCAVVRHAGLNAAAADVDALPWPLAVTEAVLPAWWAGPLVVLLVGLAVLLVDARHLARWRDATLVETDDPAWVRSAEQRLDERLEGRSWAGHAAASVGRAAVRLAHVVRRDTGQLVDAHAGSLGATGVSATRSARTLVVMQREMRQIAFHLEGEPARPRVLRVAALATLVLAVLAALVGGPALAGPVGDLAAESRWLSGLLADFAAWFDGLGGFEKVTTGAAAAAAVTIAAGALGGEAIDARTDLPSDAVPPTPVATLLGIGQAALTAGLSGVDRATSTGLHALVGQYGADPEAWRARQAGLLARTPPGS